MKHKPIKIIIADDHTIVRQGLRKLLEEEECLKIIGEAMDGREAVKKVQELKPDVVIMDIAMPVLNGIEAARQIKRSALETKVVILSMHDHNRYIRELLSIGVSGYLLKNSVSSDIIKAILSAVKGEIYLSPSISNQVIEDYVGMNQKTSQEELYNTLTNREREVFQMLVEGYPTKEIADMLCLSPSTVKSHRSNIMEKLKMDNISKLIQYAIHLGVIDIQM
ncbi:MAG: response regulator transcription factor [Desulfobacteraceae bacterium]|nr:response regulator transcription factor [Desulfobacteraceae bacterium]